jgi:hypothetical protein
MIWEVGARVEHKRRRDGRSVGELVQAWVSGQCDFAHVVSTNYSQYHMLWLWFGMDLVKRLPFGHLSGVCGEISRSPWGRRKVFLLDSLRRDRRISKNRSTVLNHPPDPEGQALQVTEYQYSRILKRVG